MKEFNIDKIKVSNKLNSICEEAVKEGYKNRVHKSSLKMLKRASIITMASFIGIGAFGITMPTYAQNIPIVGSIFKKLGGDDYSKLDEYASAINECKESNGTKVTILSVVYDGIDMTMAYKVETEQPMKEQPYICNREVKINNEITSFSSSASGNFTEDRKTYTGFINFGVSKDYAPKSIVEQCLLGGDIKIPNEFVLDININKLEGNIDGQWNFKIPVTSERAKKKTKEIECNLSLDSIKTHAKLNKIVLSPIGTYIYTKSTEDGKQSSYYDMVNFFIRDDKGRVIEDIGGRGTGITGIGHYHLFKFKEIFNDTKSLNLIPYIKNEKRNKEIIKDLSFNDEIKFDLGKFGELNIKKIEFKDSKTKVYYQCKYGEVAPITIEDKETGEYIGETEHRRSIDGTDLFVEEYKDINPNKKYVVKCIDFEKSYEVFEDKAISIKVK